MRKKAIAEEVSKDISTDGWNYRWNDVTMTADEYNTLVRDHQDWLEEQERKATMVALADKPKRSKKNT